MQIDGAGKSSSSGRKKQAQKTSARKRTAPRTVPKSTSERPRRTALVLGGGGFIGVVYEIGALRALNLLATNNSINDFDIYVGTSAGAFVAAFAANGATPEQMMRSLASDSSATFPELRAERVMQPNYSEFLTKGLKLPLHLLSSVRAVGQSIRTRSIVDLLVHFADALPSGFYSGAGVERYVRETLVDGGFSDDFRKLNKELYLCATDLDSSDRVVFGGECWDDVPISKAVRASTAIPMFYRPVECKGRVLVDGGIQSTTNIDLAVAAGAELVVVINPIVPFTNTSDQGIEASTGEIVGSVADMGFPKIAYQTFKMLMHSRLHEMMASWEQRYPEVDIVLIEPSSNDELMFETHMFDYTAKLAVAKHGFQSVAEKLNDDYSELHTVAKRHGITISRTRLEQAVVAAEAEESSPTIWQRILGLSPLGLRGN